MASQLKPENAPTKRLYSDVVQGLSNKMSPIKNHVPDMTSTKSTSDATVLTPRSFVPNEESDQNKTTKPLQMPEWNCATTSSSTGHNAKQQTIPQQSVILNNAKQVQNSKVVKENSASPGNAINNNNNNSTNYLFSTIIDCNNPCDVYSYNAYFNSNLGISNCCPNNQYQQYTTSSYQSFNSSSNNTFLPFTNYSTAQNCRPNQNTIQFNNQTHNFYINQYRNVYLTPQPYFILQQPPLQKTPQRWTQQYQQQQQQLRPNTSYNAQGGTNQYWNQNLYRSNSNQQLFTPYHHQVYDSLNGDSRQRSKTKKIVQSQTKIITNKNLEYELKNPRASCSKRTCGYSDVVPTMTGKTVFVKTDEMSSEYKLVVQKEGTS